MKTSPIGTAIILLAAAAANACSDEPSATGKSDLEIMAGECVGHAACSGKDLSTCMKLASTDDGASPLAAGWWRMLRARASCVAAAKDCEGFYSCIYGTDGKETCDLATYTERCQGDVAVKCEPIASRWAVVHEDCAAEGMKCLSSGKSAYCGHPLAAANTCVGETAVFTIGDKPAYAIGMDCGQAGKKCKDATCVDPELTSCSSNDTVCSGKGLLYCMKGFTYTFACDRISPDFVCIADGSKVACGLASAECQAGAGQCEGQVVKACVAGKRVSFDCSGFPGARCEGGTCVR